MCLRSMAVAGTAPKYLAKMSGTQVPYWGIITTFAFGLLGVVINYAWPSDAFEMVLEIATIGIIGVWSMILLSHMARVRKAKRGELVRPDFQLKGAPFWNIFGLVFMAIVLVLIATGGDNVAKAIYIGGPIVAPLMVGGWFLVRNRINAEAFDHVDDGDSYVTS